MVSLKYRRYSWTYNEASGARAIVLTFASDSSQRHVPVKFIVDTRYASCEFIFKKKSLFSQVSIYRVGDEDFILFYRK